MTEKAKKMFSVYIAEPLKLSENSFLGYIFTPHALHS